MGEFTMPSLGADMDVGTVARWLVKPGDEVHRGDIVAVVDTEKSTIDVEIFETGRVVEILVPEGESVPVGTALARVAPQGTESPPPTAPSGMVTAASSGPRIKQVPEPPAAAERPAHAAPVLSPVVRHLAETEGVDLDLVVGTGLGGRVTRRDVERAATETSGRAGVASGPALSPVRPSESMPGSRGTGSRRRASPFARRLAEELHVDLAQLPSGRGPAGAILEADVREAGSTRPPEQGAASGPATAPAPSERAVKQAAMRHAIGSLMARSKREIPHYYLSTTIDMTAASSWLEQQNLERPLPSRLVMPVLLLKATALAVAAVPEMNGFYLDDGFEVSPNVHIGVAISLRGGGVIAPAIHGVADLSLDRLMAALHDLVNRARHGSLRSSEVSDATITVTNLGDLGVESVFGVIYPPQVALVGFGRIQERPWAHEGMIGVRPTVIASLSADHRVSDGHRGGTFLTTVDTLLQRPEEL